MLVISSDLCSMQKIEDFNFFTQQTASLTSSLELPEGRFAYANPADPNSSVYPVYTSENPDQSDLVTMKPMFGITRATRAAWVTALTEGANVTSQEAQLFLDNVFQRCVNLMTGGAAEVLSETFMCIESWLQVLSCSALPLFSLLMHP